VLAQITRNNFFLWKDKDKKEVWTDKNHNKQRKSCANTNHKKHFFLWKEKDKKLVWVDTKHNKQKNVFTQITNKGAQANLSTHKYSLGI
jgi:hypothetical protein